MSEKQKMSTGKKWLIGGGVFVALAVIGQASDDESSSEPVASETTTTTTEYVEDVVEESDEQTLPEWAAENSHITDDIVATLNEMGEMAAAGDPVDMAALCGEAQTELYGWRSSLLPAPDAGVDADLTAAMDSFEEAFVACSEFEFDTSAAKLAEGNGFVQAATAKLRAYAE